MAVINTFFKQVFRGLNIKLVILSATAISGIAFIYKNKNKYISWNEKYVVIITGCDTGLGYSLAHHCHDLGLTVYACVLQSDGLGAELLKKAGDTSQRIRVIQLDVTNLSSVNSAVDDVTFFLQQHPGYRLHALVNNAGVMVFGEFEWLTERLVTQQLKVNLEGPMAVTKAVAPLLRRYEGRVINILSHCALSALPGLSVYSASKAGLLAWTDALRVEMAKFHVKVIKLIPGSFVEQSNIAARQREYSKEMEAGMMNKVSSFYGDYYRQFQDYFGSLPSQRVLVPIKNGHLYNNFNHSLLSVHPRPYYSHCPLRYSLYHLLFQVSPTWLRDLLVIRFVNGPRWEENSTYGYVNDVGESDC